MFKIQFTQQKYYYNTYVGVMHQMTKTGSSPNSLERSHIFAAKYQQSRRAKHSQ